MPPPKKNMYLNFHPCLAAHHTDKFGDIIPIGPKVIGFNTITFVCTNFRIFADPKFYRGTQIFGSNLYKAPPISHHLAKFHGDRPNGVGDFAPKLIAPKIVFGPGPHFSRLSKCTHFRSCASFTAIGRGSSEIRRRKVPEKKYQQ